MLSIILISADQAPVSFGVFAVHWHLLFALSMAVATTTKSLSYVIVNGQWSTNEINNGKMANGNRNGNRQRQRDLHLGNVKGQLEWDSMKGMANGKGRAMGTA